MAAMVAATLSLSSCDMLLDTMASMYSTPYGTMSYSTNNSYLLDPGYAMWQTQQQMSQMNTVQNQLIDLSVRQTERDMEELNRVNQQLIETSIWQAEHGIIMGGTENNDDKGGGGYTPTPTPTPQKTRQCSLCKGSGKTIKTDGLSFGNTKWCSECNKTVPDYHYHSACESCKGKGCW